MVDEARKQKIIEITNQLFREKGYAGTTMTEIAEKSEVSRRTLFRIFPNKKDLLVISNNRLSIEEWFSQQSDDKELVSSITELLKEQINVGGTDLQEKYRQWFKTLNTEPDTRSAILQQILKQMPMAVELLSKKYPNLDKQELWVTVGSFIGVVIAAWAQVSDNKKLDPLEQINENIDFVARKLGNNNHEDNQA